MTDKRETPLPDAPISERRRLRTETFQETPAQAIRDTRTGRTARPDVSLKEAEKGREGGRRHGKNATFRTQGITVNWSAVAVIILIIIVLCVIGAFLYLNLTDNGQLILARLGKDTSSEALWTYGTELLDQGYIEQSITTYEKAWKQEPDKEDIYDKLLLLAEAYEAAGRAGDAESIFYTMYQDIDKKNVLAYKNIVRLMKAEGRNTEAAQFLSLAYENTGDVTFSRQRSEMLPAAPTANLGGGKYSTYKTLELTSAEGYDIYYLFGFGTLPEDGQLYTGPIELTEGYFALHAVCISSELMSDELSVNYTITLPNPSAPYPSLASDTYNSAKVKLRNTNDFDVTIYYTIDGTSPTANSPIYTGDPIELPGGKSIHLKAVCVDAYGKVSNELDVEYEILQSFKRYFNESDEFSGFSIMSTTRDAFVRKYGNPIEETEIEDSAIPDLCMKLSYSWGEARFYSSEKGFILYHVETTGSMMTAPRSTKVGMTVREITEKFRDLGQKENQDGSRSLYHDDKQGTGMIYITDENSCRIEYVYFRNDDSQVTLCYYADNDRVNRISIRCAY